MHRTCVPAITVMGIHDAEKVKSWLYMGNNCTFLGIPFSGIGAILHKSISFCGISQTH
jgi:hypothetical protein